MSAQGTHSNYIQTLGYFLSENQFAQRSINPVLPEPGRNNFTSSGSSGHGYQENPTPALISVRVPEVVLTPNFTTVFWLMRALAPIARAV